MRANMSCSASGTTGAVAGNRRPAPPGRRRTVPAVARETQGPIDDIEQVASHHRHLVDDETLDLAHELAAARAGFSPRRD